MVIITKFRDFQVT